MTQLGEAITRYHKILDGETVRQSGWVQQLREQMTASNLVLNGRPVSPVLRPHFLSRRQYTSLVKSAESLYSAIERMRDLALESPALMARMELLPAEKMLASVDPGYRYSAVTSLLDTQVNNGHLHIVDSQADLPSGVVYADLLSEIFLDALPVKEFRKKYKLVKTGGTKALVSALAKTYKEFGGKKQPSVAILEFKQPFTTAETHEHHLLAEVLRKHGYPAELVSPDQLDYRNGVLRRGDFVIDMVYRGVRAHEFLLRFDLSHPLVRAYRERQVCIVNSFRSELNRKKTLFELLTDESLTAGFPAEERRAIKDTIPWTRLVSNRKTEHNGALVDLPEFIQQNRQSLMLRPNDDSSELQSFEGRELDAAAWERALKTALRSPYVVQERVDAVPVVFPIDFYGDVVLRELNVEVQPHGYLGKVQGCSSRISPPPGSGFSTVNGIAPTFVLETK